MWLSTLVWCWNACLSGNRSNTMQGSGGLALTSTTLLLPYSSSRYRFTSLLPSLPFCALISGSVSSTGERVRNLPWFRMLA